MMMMIITIIIITISGMVEECKRFHSRLAELLSIKKGEDYATTVSWLRPGLFCHFTIKITLLKRLKNQETDCEHSGK